MGKTRAKCIRTDKNGRETVFFVNHALVKEQLSLPKEKRAQGFKNARIVEIIEDAEAPKPELYFTEAELNDKAEKLAQEKLEKLLAEKSEKKEVKEKTKGKENE